MSKDISENTNDKKDKFIKKMVELFYKPNENDYQKEIEKAKNSKNTSDSLASFLKEYSNTKFDENAFYEMISKIINIKSDFMTLMNIYLITDDKIKVDALRKLYVLKKEKEVKLEKVENGDANNKPYFGFGINLSCLYDAKAYYDKFIVGILHYIQVVFEQNYLYQYIDIDYFKNGFQYYKENAFSLQKRLDDMLNDMLRVIKHESEQNANTIAENVESKIKKKTFSLYQAKAHLYKNEEITKIYEKSQTNEEILNELEKFLDKLPDNVEDQMNINFITFKSDIENYISNEDVKYLKKSKSINDAIIYSLKIENKVLWKEIEDLEGEIKSLKEDNLKFKNENNIIKTQFTDLMNRVNALETEVNELKVKLGYMEPMLLSLISRKVINYSIIRILETYKKKIKVIREILPNNKIRYSIEFIDSVNNISKEVLNALIDKIYIEKDNYNADSHLFKKEKSDLWNKLKENLKLNQNEITAFDAIITDKIKSDFDFGDRDLSVNDYLSGVNINEFGN